MGVLLSATPPFPPAPPPRPPKTHVAQHLCVLRTSSSPCGHKVMIRFVGDQLRARSEHLVKGYVFRFGQVTVGVLLGATHVHHVAAGPP